jgi:RNA-directed DNA polymerase
VSEIRAARALKASLPDTGLPRKLHAPDDPRPKCAPLKRISRVVRHWRLHRRIYHTWEELAAGINSVVAGWMQYYGRYYRSALYRLLARINAYLVRWIRNKYRGLAGVRASRRKFAELAQASPTLFAQWRWVRTAW